MGRQPRGDLRFPPIVEEFLRANAAPPFVLGATTTGDTVEVTAYDARGIVSIPTIAAHDRLYRCGYCGRSCEGFDRECRHCGAPR